MVFLSKNKKFKAYLDHLKQGKILLYPTETIWGLGVDAMNQKAVELLYRFKKRDPKKPVSLLVRNIRVAKKIALISASVEKLIELFCPGPVTFVLPLKKPSLSFINAGSNFIGIRFSSHPFSSLLAWSYKNPITSTSANWSGEKPISLKKMAQSSKDIKLVSMQDFGWSEEKLEETSKKKWDKDFLKPLEPSFTKNKKLVQKKNQKNQGSTVVQIKDQKITFLREGPVGLEDFVRISSQLGFRD